MLSFCTISSQSPSPLAPTKYNFVWHSADGALCDKETLTRGCIEGDGSKHNSHVHLLPVFANYYCSLPFIVSYPTYGIVHGKCTIIFTRNHMSSTPSVVVAPAPALLPLATTIVIVLPHRNSTQIHTTTMKWTFQSSRGLSACLFREYLFASNFHGVRNKSKSPTSRPQLLQLGPFNKLALFF